VAVGGIVTAQAAKTATSTIPIVFLIGTDPVADGLVASFARPGHNLTGISLLIGQLYAKRLELLSELVPQAGVIAVLVDPNSTIADRTVKDIEEAARSKGLRIEILWASTSSEIEAAFALLAERQADALLVSAAPFLDTRREQLVEMAARHGIPAMYAWQAIAASGGLISYGASLAGGYRQLGIYAGRILKGTSPADLPVQQPTKFELTINLKTARALGLTVPQSLLARADEVIE
jgi:putative ABC transport system substrate-binding protein